MRGGYPPSFVFPIYEKTLSLTKTPREAHLIPLPKMKGGTHPPWGRRGRRRVAQKYPEGGGGVCLVEKWGVSPCLTVWENGDFLT